MSKAKIRMANIEDAEQINEIYETYIMNTAISFEYNPVPIADFRERIRSTLTKLPYLVCEMNDKIVGYAYLSPFHSREAYGWDVETTVYIHKDYHKRHIGKALYQCLFELAKELGYYNIYALIEDSNCGSIKLHEVMGFEHVGLYPRTGYKFGKWWGLAVMCKCIGDFNVMPKPIKNINQITTEQIQLIAEKYEISIV